MQRRPTERGSCTVNNSSSRSTRSESLITGTIVNQREETLSMNPFVLHNNTSSANTDSQNYKGRSSITRLYLTSAHFLFSHNTVTSTSLYPLMPTGTTIPATRGLQTSSEADEPHLFISTISTTAHEA